MCFMNLLLEKYDNHGFTKKNCCVIAYVYSDGRSSRPEVFCKKGVLGNFAKFTGKYLCQSLFFNKVAGAACNFIKKEILAQLFSCEFCEISKNTFSQRTPLVAASVMAELQFKMYGIPEIRKYQ